MRVGLHVSGNCTATGAPTPLNREARRSSINFAGAFRAGRSDPLTGRSPPPERKFWDLTHLQLSAEQPQGLSSLRNETDVSQPKVPDLSEFHSHLERLSSAAARLNELSDELGKQVSEVEAAINRLGLGIYASVEFNSTSDEDGTESENWYLAYGKLNGKWGVLIERLFQRYTDGFADTKAWHFKDAPRDQRLRAVDHIPSLLEALTRKSDEFTSKVAAKVDVAKRLTSALNQPRNIGTEK